MGGGFSKLRMVDSYNSRRFPLFHLKIRADLAQFTSYLVEAALDRGHEVTLFHRGQTHPDLFPNLDHIRGDREKNLLALSGRHWDAVIDTCGYVPRVVRAVLCRIMIPASPYKPATF